MIRVSVLFSICVVREGGSKEKEWGEEKVLQKQERVCVRLN